MLSEKQRDVVIQYNILSSEINALYHEISLKMGISDSVQIVLYVLRENENRCLQSEIVKQSGVNKQTINSAVHRLLAEEIICLERGHGRSTIVALTETGTAYAKEKIDPILNIEREIFEEWTDQERRLYIELTERYCNSFRIKVNALQLR